MEIVRAVLARIQANVACYFEAGGTPHAFRRLLLEDPQGGLPRGFIGDDLHEAIATKFSAVFEAVCDVWVKRIGIDRVRLSLRIHPSAAEKTYIDILYEPAHPSGRVFLLYTIHVRRLSPPCARRAAVPERANASRGGGWRRWR